MPTYCFGNKETGEMLEVVWSISQMEAKTNGTSYKDDNGAVWQRDFGAEQGVGSSFSQNWPMRSDACGVHPSDADKAGKASAEMGVPTRFDSKTGQAIFESRNHRAKYMKARGFYDRNGGYADG